MELESKIEGLLFYKGEEMATKEIASLLKTTIPEVEEALGLLETSLSGRGLALIRKDSAVMLGVAPELSNIIESMRKEDLARDLSKASLETLSIVLYKSGCTRSEIDYIRGVNSSFILRNLLIRGLIEKAVDERDSRRMIYKPSFDLLSFMGVQSIRELPNFETVVKELNQAASGLENND